MGVIRVPLAFRISTLFCTGHCKIKWRTWYFPITSLEIPSASLTNTHIAFYKLQVTFGGDGCCAAVGGGVSGTEIRGGGLLGVGNTTL